MIQGRPPGGNIVVPETSSSTIQQSEHNPRSAYSEKHFKHVLILYTELDVLSQVQAD